MASAELFVPPRSMPNEEAMELRELVLMFESSGASFTVDL